MNNMKTIALLVMVALAATACGNKEEKKAASQIAAKVNSGEISVHQINFVLQRTPGLPPEKAEEAKRQILDGLIDQEIAVQQAVETKLDRNPNVVQQIEAAKREILARAYMEQITANKGKPSDDEIAAFYKMRPELFSARKLYRLEELVFEAKPAAVAAARDLAGKGKPTAEIAAALKAQGVQVGGGVSVKPAEQISLDLLPKLAQAKEGVPQVFENGGKAAVVTVLATKPEPLTDVQAKPFIERYIGNRDKGEVARETMKGLRAKAKIEYVGDFGKDAEADRKKREEAEAKQSKELKDAREAARKVQEEESARKAEEAKKAREAAEAERAKGAQNAVAKPSEGALSKGISGLK